jgi:hypothetical protein
MPPTGSKVLIYKIASGQMKADPVTIKSVLEDAFLMTGAWKGIILLDEADIFLESRSVNDLDRNQLVSGHFINPYRTQDFR